VFGHIAAAEAINRGHDVRLASRRSPDLPIDATDTASVQRAIPRARADAVLLAFGPFQQQPPSAAEAAQRAGVPYADISDEQPFSERVAKLGHGVPLLTGMSTTPAVVEALAALALRRAPEAQRIDCALYAAAGNRQGPAAVRFGIHARLRGPSRVVDFPGVGRHRAHPARGHFDPAVPGIQSRVLVAFDGLASLGWHLLPLLKPVAPLAARMPRISSDTSTAIVVEAFDAQGARASWEGLFARESGQRVAALPAVWALEQALAGRAPLRGALPKEWVVPDALLSFLVENGLTRVSGE
jgi:hypothetical protein